MTRKNDLEREKCGRNFYVQRNWTHHFYRVPRTRVSSYVAPENRQSREHRRINGLSLSLSVFRLDDCVERKIDFQTQSSKIEENFFLTASGRIRC